MDAKQAIRRYVLHNLVLTDDESVLRDGDSFLTQGIIDSAGILEIMFFIETTFNIKVSQDEILPENLDSVDNLVAFVQRKQVVAA